MKSGLLLVKEQIATLTGRKVSEIGDAEKLSDVGGDAGVMTLLVFAANPKPGMTVADLGVFVDQEMVMV